MEGIDRIKLTICWYLLKLGFEYNVCIIPSFYFCICLKLYIRRGYNIKRK